MISRLSIKSLFFIVALALIALGGHGFGGAQPAWAADMQESPANAVKLGQRAARACTEDCIARCRAMRNECGNGKESGDSCRTQFQICARRCVVTCSPR